MSTDPLFQKYQAWLASNGHSSSNSVSAEGSSEDGSFQFFYSGSQRAAVSTNAVVTLGKGEGWFGFLISANPVRQQGQVAWLQGNDWTPLRENDEQLSVLEPLNPGLGDVLEEPGLNFRADGGRGWDAWFVDPSTQKVFRYRIIAYENGQAQFIVESLDDILE